MPLQLLFLFTTNNKTCVEARDICMPLIVGLFWLCLRSLLTLVLTVRRWDPLSIVGLFWLCLRSLLTLVLEQDERRGQGYIMIVGLF
jgi:hypothetical protein